MTRKANLLLCLLTAFLMSSCANAQQNQRWTPQQANAWYDQQPWLVGCNFNPSTASNQFEMWQADTFDPETIDRELGWASDLGMNFIRLYIHDMLWTQDSQGLLQRMDQFLAIADKHDIRIMFVLFDACWDPHPALGCQAPPRPHTHNSRWVQSPHNLALRDPAKYDAFKPFVQGVLRRFANDPRVLCWDLYNEPGNMNGEVYRRWEPKNKPELSLQLLTKAFAWAREVGPSQPLTAGVWEGEFWNDLEKTSPLNRFMLENSDVITFHTYDQPDHAKQRTMDLTTHGRPLICTEYLARPRRNNTFQALLPFWAENRVGASNWGLVAGKTNTIYPWWSWDDAFTAEPEVWFHDIFRPDGTPYDPAEVEFIKNITQKTRANQ